MRTRQLVGVSALACFACGAPAPTATTVEGSVNGVSFADPHALYLKHAAQDLVDQNRVFVLVSDDADACQALGPVGLMGRSGITGPGNRRAPSLWLDIPDRSLFVGRQTEVGHGLSSDFDPATDAGLSARTEPAQSGFAWLDRADALTDKRPEAAGSFDLSFDGGSLRGTFRATPCTQLAPGCAAAGAGPMLFALPLLLAVRRRRYS
jgi:hypothetical protein